MADSLTSRSHPIDVHFVPAGDLPPDGKIGFTLALWIPRPLLPNPNTRCRSPCTRRSTSDSCRVPAFGTRS